MTLTEGKTSPAPQSATEAIAAHELILTLDKVGQDVLQTFDEIGASPHASKSWQRARELVQEFQPVPWVIWKLSKYAIGTNEKINKLVEPSVLGLRRLLFAAASDRVLGAGEKIADVRTALQVLPSDVVAAVAVIHGICRRLHSFENERFWRPVLEDALLRAHLGFYVGQVKEDYGPGRGMLAGVAGRIGYAVLLASGDSDKAARAQELVASGHDLQQSTLEVYGIDHLHVGALIMSAAGCGRDAAFGIVAFASHDQRRNALNSFQLRWLACIALIDGIRMGTIEGVDQGYWEELCFSKESDRNDLLDLARMAIRRGHGWNWIVKSE